MKTGNTFKRNSFFAVCLIGMLILLVSSPVRIMAKTAGAAKPVVLTKTISDASVSARVLGVKGGVVTVKAGKKTIASKKFSADGVKTITLKKQKAGTKLTFTQTVGGKKSAPVIKTVKRLVSKSVSKKVVKPVVKTGTITSNTTKIKIKGAKGTTVFIVSDNGKKAAGIKFKKSATKTITIKKQTGTDSLFFYAAKGKKRSAIVRKAVKDKTPPSLPTVSELTSTSIKVKGEVGATVYVRSGAKDVYEKSGLIRSSSGLVIKNHRPDREGCYYVKLQDASKNTSKVLTVRSKYAGGNGSPGGDGSGGDGTGDKTDEEHKHTWMTEKRVKNLYTKDSISLCSLLDISVFADKVNKKYGTAISGQEQVTLMGSIELDIGDVYTLDKIRKFSTASELVNEILAIRKENHVTVDSYMESYGISCEDVFELWAEEMDSWAGHMDWLCWGNARHRYWPYNVGTEGDMIPGYSRRGGWGTGYIGKAIVGQVVLDVRVCSACGEEGPPLGYIFDKYYDIYGTWGYNWHYSQSGHGYDYVGNGLPDTWEIIMDTALPHYNDGESPKLSMDARGYYNLGILRVN